MFWTCRRSSPPLRREQKIARFVSQLPIFHNHFKVIWVVPSSRKNSLTPSGTGRLEAERYFGPMNDRLTVEKGDYGWLNRCRTGVADQGCCDDCIAPIIERNHQR
jgi:hypothetical protein